MRFKEFESWCGQRACDGCRGMAEAVISMIIIQTISEEPFWRREKLWKEGYEERVVKQIVNPTEQKIKEALGDEPDKSGKDFRQILGRNY